MPKVGDIYKSAASKWLKAHDLKNVGRDTVEVFIASQTVMPCRLYKSSETEDRIVLTLNFREPKKWEINKTNAKILTNFLGEDFDHWPGNKIGIRLKCGVQLANGDIVDQLIAYNPDDPPSEFA